jgi:hypothetical protein
LILIRISQLGARRCITHESSFRRFLAS